MSVFLESESFVLWILRTSIQDESLCALSRRHELVLQNIFIWVFFAYFWKCPYRTCIWFHELNEWPSVTIVPLNKLTHDSFSRLLTTCETKLSNVAHPGACPFQQVRAKALFRLSFRFSYLLEHVLWASVGRPTMALTRCRHTPSTTFPWWFPSRTPACWYSGRVYLSLTFSPVPHFILHTNFLFIFWLTLRDKNVSLFWVVWPPHKCYAFKTIHCNIFWLFLFSCHTALLSTPYTLTSFTFETFTWYCEFAKHTGKSLWNLNSLRVGIRFLFNFVNNVITFTYRPDRHPYCLDYRNAFPILWLQQFRQVSAFSFLYRGNSKLGSYLTVWCIASSTSVVSLPLIRNHSPNDAAESSPELSPCSWCRNIRYKQLK